MRKRVDGFSPTFCAHVRESFIEPWARVGVIERLHALGAHSFGGDIAELVAYGSKEVPRACVERLEILDDAKQRLARARQHDTLSGANHSREYEACVNDARSGELIVNGRIVRSPRRDSRQIRGGAPPRLLSKARTSAHEPHHVVVPLLTQDLAREDLR
jgi:hypothetical protein